MSAFETILNTFESKIDLQPFQAARLNMPERTMRLIAAEIKMLEDMMPYVDMDAWIGRSIQKRMSFMTGKLHMLEKRQAEGLIGVQADSDSDDSQDEDTDTIKKEADQEARSCFALDSIPKLIRGRSFFIKEVTMHHESVQGLHILHKSRLRTHMLTWSKTLILSSINYGARVMKRSSWLAGRFVLSLDVLDGTNVLVTLVWDGAQGRCSLAVWSLKTPYEEDVNRCDNRWMPKAVRQFEKGVLLSMRVNKATSHVICFGSSGLDGGTIVYVFHVKRCKPKLVAQEEYGINNVDCQMRWPELYLAFYSIPSGFIMSQINQDMALSWSRTGAMVAFNLSKGHEMEPLAMT